MAVAGSMWLRGFGVFLTAVLLTVDPARAQQAGPAFDWLSPEPLAWADPNTFNWATSPLKLNVHEYGSYNSNILGIPSPGPNQPSTLKPGQTQGDFLLNTNVGASTRFNAWSQKFYADASYNVINYRNNIGFDGHNYNVDAGVNWVATSHCSGTLTAVSSQRQAAQEDSFGPGISTVRLQSVAETGQCGIYQNVSAILNSGIASMNQTAVGARRFAGNALDNVTAYAQGGLQYQWTDLNNLQFLTKISDIRYTNRFVVAAADALNSTSILNARYTNYSLVYNRTFSEMLNASASAGFATISQETFGGRQSNSTPKTPTFAFHAAWLPTPKWSFFVNVSRSVSPPTSVLAGTQIGNVESVVANYQWTPKLSLSLTASRNYLAGAQTLNNLITLARGGYGANTFLSALARATYQITPFTSATVSVQKTERTYARGTAQGEIVLFGLDYQPQ
jgi:hypothetical protein